MPTLGFLKKKRTKDSSGSNHPSSPTSPVSDSPLTPTSSRGFGGSIASVSSQTSYHQSQPGSTKPSDSMITNQRPLSGGPTSSPHTSGQSYHQQNVPSINNIINAPQQDAMGQSHQQQMNGRGNGAGLNGPSLGLNLNHASGLVPDRPAVRATKGKYSLSDFIIQRTLGTGSFGRVHLVQSKHNQRFYAVKVLKKQQVVKMKQVEHTNDERKMLQRVKHPFLITLWGTFQDSRNLYMVMDFVEGGELFSLLRKSHRLFYLLLQVLLHL